MYKLTNHQAVTRISDGALIPVDPENTDYQDYLTWESKGNSPIAATPISAIVPQVVSRFQARAALLRTPSHNAYENMLAEVDAVMTHQDTDPMARLAWTDAQEFKRTSPTIQAIAPLLDLSDQDLDQLFSAAAGIDA